MSVFLKNGLACSHLETKRYNLFTYYIILVSPAWAGRTCKPGACLCHTPGRGWSLANQRASFELLTNESSPILEERPGP